MPSDLQLKVDMTQYDQLQSIVLNARYIAILSFRVVYQSINQSLFIQEHSP